MINRLIHSLKLIQARKRLSKLDRNNLMLRRAVVEFAISHAVENNLPWRDEDLKLGNGLSAGEQHDLIQEALGKLPNPNPPVAVGLQSGKIKLRTPGVGG